MKCDMTSSDLRELSIVLPLLLKFRYDAVAETIGCISTVDASRTPLVGALFWSLYWSLYTYTWFCLPNVSETEEHVPVLEAVKSKRHFLFLIHRSTAQTPVGLVHIAVASHEYPPHWSMISLSDHWAIYQISLGGCTSMRTVWTHNCPSCTSTVSQMHNLVKRHGI